MRSELLTGHMSKRALRISEIGHEGEYEIGHEGEYEHYDVFLIFSNG